MDSKIRNLAIVLVISVFALIGGLVFYENNKENGTSKTQEAAADGVDAAGTSQTGGAGDGNGTGIADNGLSEAELHAFMQDDTFWDPEPTASVSYNLIPKLYMLATSVQQDMRITIVDDSGAAVTGHSFYVDVDGSEYKDLDQDGVIYIPDLRSGEYLVSLEPESGYQVPEDPMYVTVKDQLEFTVIDDISYMIVSEAEIDASVEDTEEDVAGEDIDETENTGLMTGYGTAIGIDVSKWQKEIDWDKVAASGVQFAIIRCGYRGSASGCLVEDPYFIQNIEGAKNAGIKVGVYFFTQATNEVEAVEEASMVATLCNGYSLDYPVFIDTESAGGNGRADGLSVEQRTSVCDAFCKTLQSSGFTAGVYASRCWFYDNLNDDALQDYVIWVAEYRSSPIYTGNFKMWQYTSSGYVDGITTRVDMDICY